MGSKVVRYKLIVIWYIISLTLLEINSLFSQTEFSINKLLIPAIEEGWMEVSEAEVIRIHLLKYGWPVVPEEAWAIQNIRPEVSKKLSENPRWRLWCEWAKEVGVESNSKSKSIPIKWNIIGMGDFNNEDYKFEGSNIGCVARVRSENWGAVVERDAGEVGIDFIGGFVNGNAKNGVSWIVGDHRIHWGSGATISRYDPFQSMRAPHRLVQISRDFDGVYSGDGSPMRRGVAIRKNIGNWWFAGSFDSQNREYSLTSTSDISWFNTGLHRTLNEIQRESVYVNRLAFAAFSKPNYLHHSIRLGVLGEVGKFMGQSWTGIVGGVFRIEKDALSFESELGCFNKGFVMRNRAVLSVNRNVFLFGVVDREDLMHPGRNWGAKSNSELHWVGSLGVSVGPKERNLIIVSEIKDMRSSFKATLVHKTSETDIWDIQSRLKLFVKDDGTYEVSGRMRWDLGLIRLTGEFFKSGVGIYGWGRSFRIDVKSAKPLTIAVMNGVSEMEGRLYSLLPTSRGYRLFSVGDNTYRTIITYEIVPDKLVLSFEKVWPEGGDTHSSQRISIRLEGR
ncbi:MAG: hypothetical protein COA49_07595 [Bacteroidetes bacterium]|nr:MAG: hypothetical protein COA49_07595 [Bacteroidota bacterium]